MRRVGASALVACAAVLAAAPAAVAAPGLAQLPSPTAPLDATLPLGDPANILQLPPSGRVTSRERVRAELTPNGEVIAIRVSQQLTVTGTGDFFFVVPGPLRDVRAGAGSEAEPGLRRTGIVWQGFANRRRVLVADAVLVPAAAAQALPLRVELRAAVAGRPLGAARRDGRLELTLTLRNATAVHADTFTADPASDAELHRVLDRIESSFRGGVASEELAIRVDGSIRRRRLLVDAPLRVHGELRLPAARLAGPVVRGGEVVREPGVVVVRFARLLGGPAPPTATVSLTGTVRGARRPEASVSADPEAVVPELRRPRGAGAELVLLAARSLLRLARVRQYDSFLANPAPGGRSETTYRFRVAEAERPAATPEDNEGGTGVVLTVALAGAAVLAVGGLAVLWAHL